MYGLLVLLFSLLLSRSRAVPTKVLGHDNPGHWDQPLDNCSEGVNYMPPFKDGSVLDPCEDGDCWTYCDHMEWHDTEFNASEFSEDHLLEEQYECLASACTNFFYGHINLQVLEECAHFKCLVSQPNILDSRPCALTLLHGSSIYALIEKHKLQFERWAQGNRSLVEYGKHHFMYRVNTILDEQHSSIWNLELTVHDMNTLLEIKDPVAENDMIVKILGGLDQSVEDSEMIGTHIENASNHTIEIRDRLWVIFYQKKVVETFAGALEAVKEYLDQVRRDVIRSYVYNGTVCTPPEVMMADIEENCDMCSHGTCHFNSTDIYFYCTCDLGWTGEYCDRPITSCVDDPCINGGACFNEYGSFRCECPSTWVGRYCETAVDESAGCVDTDAHPCQNGAVCTDYPMSYQCECSFGWMGRNCQYALRSCEQINPCDRGDCSFNGTRLQCICPVEPTYQQPFWVGDTCSIQQKECDYVQNELDKWSLVHGSPCSGHGLCTLDETNTGWTCLCASSHIGLRCSIPIDEANQCVIYGIDCVHGSCDHCQNKNDCQCECDAGFDGDDCSIALNPCDPNPCSNNAPCKVDLIDFYCDCSSIEGSYGGKTCESKVTCADKPCGDNAIACNDESSDLSGIKCVCEAGTVGDRCEKDISTCTASSCFNGGNCVQGMVGFCQCINGYTGDRCQNEPSFCNDNPCGSYGQCSVISDGYICECDIGWEGAQCNHNIDECDPTPCVNDATCIDLINDYECVCSDDWRGVHCEIKRTPCDDVVCENHGICIDTRNEDWTDDAFKCACPTDVCTREIPEDAYTITQTRWFASWWYLAAGVAAGVVLTLACFSYWHCAYSGRTPRKHRNLMMMN